MTDDKSKKGKDDLTRPPPKRIAESRTELSELMQPNHANFSGNVHGGVLLAMLDRIAYIAACKHSNHYCVTASVDRVDFHSSVKVGEILHLFASVNYVGRSSMEIGIRVQSENLLSGEHRHTNTCFFTMVAVGEDFKPVPVPELVILKEDDRRRNEEGRKRATLRKEAARQWKAKQGG